MITITILLIALLVLAGVICILPVIALPLLDIVVVGAAVLYLVKIVKKFFKKKKDEA